MSGNTITNGCEYAFGKVKKFCMDNKAHIYTGLGVIGTVTTGVLAAKSGARAARKIDRKEAEIGRRLTRKEKVRLCGPEFISPAVAGALGIFGTVRSDMINTRTIGEQTALLIASEKAYKKLEEKTKEVLGEKKARQVKDEIAKEKLMGEPNVITAQKLSDAPRSGNGQLFPYLDGYTGLLFWSNPDYISCCVMSMQKMMKELAPRNDEFDYQDKIIGVPYSEWLKSLNFEPRVWNTRERRNCGWNKGFAKDGVDDDEISYSTTAVEYEPGFAVTVIEWETQPSNMRLGRLMKSNGL